ncbi:hypothetical protein BC830DRAFT_1101159 [Chytriomyces sp. MP71]|nr:hypothetical protein BC830DRAFT_1101159 [Chytriomyces sp. MP71]
MGSKGDDAFAGLVSFSTSTSNAGHELSLEEQRRRGLGFSSPLNNANNSNNAKSGAATPVHRGAGSPGFGNSGYSTGATSPSLAPANLNLNPLPIHSSYPNAGHALNYNFASSTSNTGLARPVSVASPPKNPDPFADLLGTSPRVSAQAHVPLNAIPVQTSPFNTTPNGAKSSSSTPVMTSYAMAGLNGNVGLNSAFATPQISCPIPTQVGFQPSSGLQSPQNGLYNVNMNQFGSFSQAQQSSASLLQQQRQHQLDLKQQPLPNNDIWNFDALAVVTSAAAPLPAPASSSPVLLDPFEIGFSSTSATIGSSDVDDDPFGILTGKPIQPLPAPSREPKVISSPSIPPPSRSPQALHTIPTTLGSAPHSRAQSNGRDANVAAIVDMGFDVQAANTALDAANGDLQAAIDLLIANREAVEGFGQVGGFSSRGASRVSPAERTGATGRGWMEDAAGVNAGPTATAVLSNAKSLFDMGRAKLSQVYEKASEKVAAFATSSGGESEVQQRERERWQREQWQLELQQEHQEHQEQRSRYRDSSSDEEEEQEIALHRKPRPNREQNATAGGAGTASPRGKSPMTSSLRLSRDPSTETRFGKQVSFNEMSSATSSAPMAPLTPQPVHTATPMQRAAASAAKELGNTAFKQGQFGDAEAQYTAALVLLPGEDWDTLPLRNNRAAARLKTGDYVGAVADCDAVLAILPRDVKALTRRAAAWEGREKWEEAAKDYEMLMVVEPGKGVSAGLARARKGLAVHVGGDAAMVGGGTGSVGSSVAPVRSAVEELAFLAGVGGRNEIAFTGFATSAKPVPASVKLAVDKAVEAVRQQNEQQEKEEDLKFQVKEDVEARIESWKRGKEANIRALLSSLDTILWPDLNWNTINLSELITPQQVKVRYMKAVAKVHPDKLKQGTTVEQKLIANEVFAVLNKAWDAFKMQSGL